MTVLLDIYDNHCVIWFGNYVTTIKGRPEEICREICMRIIVPVDINSGTIFEQIYEVGLEINTPGGRVYKDLFNSMGIQTFEVCSRHVDLILPKRVYYVPDRIGKHLNIIPKVSKESGPLL